HAIGRCQGIKLQRVTADRQFLLVGGSSDRTIDAGKAPAALFIPCPDFGRLVGGDVGHQWLRGAGHASHVANVSWNVCKGSPSRRAEVARISEATCRMARSRILLC